MFGNWSRLEDKTHRATGCRNSTKLPQKLMQGTLSLLETAHSESFRGCHNDKLLVLFSKSKWRFKLRFVVGLCSSTEHRWNRRTWKLALYWLHNLWITLYGIESSTTQPLVLLFIWGLEDQKKNSEKYLLFELTLKGFIWFKEPISSPSTWTYHLSLRLTPIVTTTYVFHFSYVDLLRIFSRLWITI